MCLFGLTAGILRTGFPYSSRVNGYIKGYKRVFYQGSTDHRGVPGAPGRVVTLIHDPNSITVRFIMSRRPLPLYPHACTVPLECR